MSCATWFKIPKITDKAEIIAAAQKALDTLPYFTNSEKIMYQYAVDQELVGPVCSLANFILTDFSNQITEEWVMYQNVEDASLEEYNLQNGTSHNKYGEFVRENQELFEFYSNEPRISGYPENIIRSYQEMLSFMATGFTDEEGTHHDFYYQQERYPVFMAGIKTFFEKHPDGIITFG